MEKNNTKSSIIVTCISGLILLGMVSGCVAVDVRKNFETSTPAPTIETDIEKSESIEKIATAPATEKERVNLLIEEEVTNIVVDDIVNEFMQGEWDSVNASITLDRIAEYDALYDVHSYVWDGYSGLLVRHVVYKGTRDIKLISAGSEPPFGEELDYVTLFEKHNQIDDNPQKITEYQCSKCINGSKLLWTNGNKVYYDGYHYRR